MAETPQPIGRERYIELANMGLQIASQLKHLRLEEIAIILDTIENIPGEPNPTTTK